MRVPSFLQRFVTPKSVAQPLANLNPNQFRTEAEAFLRKKQFYAAIPAYTKALHYYPRSVDLFYCRGLAFFCAARELESKVKAQELFTKASKDFEAVITLAPTHAGAYKLLALTSFYLNPESNLFASIHFIKAANIYFASNDFEPAISCFNMALQLNPESVDALTGLSLVYKQSDRREETVTILAKLGELYISQGRPLDAAKIESEIKIKFSDVVAGRTQPKPFKLKLLPSLTATEIDALGDISDEGIDLLDAEAG